MKNSNIHRLIGLLTFSFFLSAVVFAQKEKPFTKINNLPELILEKDISLHIISPEPIQFVDLSTDLLVGDLPSENIARIKFIEEEQDSINDTPDSPSDNIGIITVVAQSFMAQYKVINPNGNHNLTSTTNLQIQPEHMQPLNHSFEPMSHTELQRLSKRILSTIPKRPIRQAKNQKMLLSLNNVYIMEDYIFLDISFVNKTHLNYDIDKVDFSIEDKKIYKATNTQSIPLKAFYQFHHVNSFRRNYRNIYVMKKFTYPNSKVLVIRFSEKQISGRTTELKINYADILKADSF